MFANSSVSPHSERGEDPVMTKRRVEVIRKFLLQVVNKRVRAENVDFELKNVLVLAMKMADYRPKYAELLGDDSKFSVIDESHIEAYLRNSSDA